MQETKQEISDRNCEFNRNGLCRIDEKPCEFSLLNKALCETCRFNNEGVCGVDAEPLENIDPEGCIFYEINRKTTKNR